MARGARSTLDDAEKARRLCEFASGSESGVWPMDHSALSAEQRVFQAIWELEAEVNNGGFRQFFWNSSGCLAPHAVDALHTIDAPRAASIVEKAIGLVGRVRWSDDTRRKKQIDALQPKTVAALDKLDQSFFTYPDDLNDLLYRYVCRNRAQLRAPASAFPDEPDNAATAPAASAGSRRRQAGATASGRAAAKAKRKKPRAKARRRSDT